MNDPKNAHEHPSTLGAEQPKVGSAAWSIYTDDGKSYGADENTFRNVLASIVNAGLNIIRMHMFKWTGDAWERVLVAHEQRPASSEPPARDESALMGAVITGNQSEHNGRELPAFEPPEREVLTAGKFTMRQVASVSNDCRDLGAYLARFQNGRVTLKPNQVAFVASALQSAGNMLEPLGERPGAPVGNLAGKESLHATKPQSPADATAQ